MGKINIDKVNGFSPIRSERQIDVKRSNDPGHPVGKAKEIAEDRLDLSVRASEVGNLVETLKEMPDVRQDKVDRLRKQIASGSYDPSADEIAEAIIRDESS
jgi:negative regulator of flagellin synthesis FlgM